MQTQQIGAQLFTVRAALSQDFASTLRDIAAIGYPTVELIQQDQLTVAEQHAALVSAGLRAPTSHVSIDRMRADPAREIAAAKVLGVETIVIPWLSPEWRTPARFAALAAQLNQLGRHCADAGLTLSYHNHDFEFAQQDGQRLFDILLDATDPALVTFEFDIYWSAFAGVDPVAFLTEHGPRIRQMHLKDLAPDRTFTEVGDGTLDMPRILRAAQTAGVAWYYVENDDPRIPALESLRRSWENLQPMLLTN